MLWTNATKEAIRLGGGGAWVGVKKLILWNNDKSSETHYRLIVVNGVYETRHVTHSIILLPMHNMMILIIRWSIYKKKSVLRQ